MEQNELKVCRLCGAPKKPGYNYCQGCGKNDDIVEAKAARLAKINKSNAAFERFMLYLLGSVAVAFILLVAVVVWRNAF